LLVASVLLYSSPVGGGPYLDSAHGNTSYGVNRTSIDSFGYAKANCAHCHEQKASIGGDEPAPDSPAGPDIFLLFSDNYTDQTTGFCFDCHKGTGSYQTTAFNNYNYSYRASGDTSITCPTNILEAFSFINETGSSVLNCGSTYGTSHKLTDIQTFITGKWGYTANSNPCIACHNPHRAKRDPHTSGSRGWPVSRPSGHTDTSTWELWGDDATERMNQYTYQAPNAASGYEPDGSTTQDGSNLTDYVTFCTDCHNATNTIYSTRLVRDLYTFNWTTEKHGSGAASNDAHTDVLSPYQEAQLGSYVLSCTDCHEPHGAPNIFLTRQTVNKGTVTVLTGTGTGPQGKANKEWVYLCEKCHGELLDDTPDLHSHPTTLFETSCNALCHPGGGDYAPCGDCHYHGNSEIDGTPYGEPLF